MKSGHVVVKVVTTYSGVHYSNLYDFTASTCSHSLCRTSGAEDTWRNLEIYLFAAKSWLEYGTAGRYRDGLTKLTEVSHLPR